MQKKMKSQSIKKHLKQSVGFSLILVLLLSLLPMTVLAEDLEQLTDAQTEVALQVQDMISELLPVNELQLTDEQAIVKAELAYDGLSEAQKVLVESSPSLPLMLSRMGQLKYEKVTDVAPILIGDIESLPDTINRDQLLDTQAIIKRYERLYRPAWTKAVDEAVGEKYKSLKTQAESLENENKKSVDEAKSLIANVPKEGSQLNHEDKIAILDALDSYESLPLDLEAKLDEQEIQKLATAYRELREANHVNGAISAEDNGVLPNDVELIVGDLSEEERSLLNSQNTDILGLFDISLRNIRNPEESYTLSGEQNLRITWTLDKNPNANADELIILHGLDDQTVETLRVVNVNNNQFSFYATAFSPFAVARTAGNITTDGTVTGGAAKTSDETNLPLYIALVSLSGIALIILRKKVNA